MNPTPRTLRGAAVLAAAACLAGALAGAAPASAQPIRPWAPGRADSLLAWASQARAKFRTNSGDSVSGANYEAYALVSRIARRLLFSLGRANAIQAHAVETVLDSLGLDTEVALDPTEPTFALVMVHNPFRDTAGAAGFFFWYRGEDLRAQGVAFRGGRAPRIKVWWTANAATPYEWAVVNKTGWGDSLAFTLLKLNSNGLVWGAFQYDGFGPDLSRAHQAVLVDINNDLRPELLAWQREKPDSIFDLCPGCPGLVTEQVYTEAPQGFELNDTRLIPSAFANFTLFIHLLRDSNRAAAARLLNDPARVDEAVAQGWGSGHGRGLWKIENVEEDRQWPTWFALRFKGPKGDQRWVVHFTQKDGRWVIREWTPIVSRSGTARPAPRPGAGGARDTSRAGRGAGAR